MLEINKIRENKESIISLLKVRNKDFSHLIQDALTQDELRRKSQLNRRCILLDTRHLKISSKLALLS